MLVPEPTAGPTCETPQKLVCGPGQILKLDTKPNGCQSFICECKPIEDCETINSTTEKPLEDGYVREIDDSGCCPIETIICKPELCPPAKDCPQYHTLKTQDIGKCCPLYSCEPPKDKCIYDTQFIAAEKGGERKLTRYEKQKVLKNANETWTDGPCRECQCLLTSIGNYQASCSKTECPSIEHHSDINDYELIAEPQFEKCCPNIKRTACRYHGQIYQLGDKWTKQSDSCVTYECVKGENGVQKETQLITCDKSCDLGYEYVPSTNPQQCCGNCKAIGCVVDGKVRKINEEWTSADFCTNFYCINANGSINTQSILVNCPDLPLDYIENFKYETVEVEGQCCKEFKMTACKIGGQVLNVNQTAPSPDGDKCKTITCLEKSNGELVKQESVETCKKNCSQVKTTIAILK